MALATCPITVACVPSVRQGWGQSFHFANKLAGETFSASIARHEYYLAMRLGVQVAELLCWSWGVGWSGACAHRLVTRLSVELSTCKALAPPPPHSPPITCSTAAAASATTRRTSSVHARATPSSASTSRVPPSRLRAPGARARCARTRPILASRPRCLQDIKDMLQLEPEYWLAQSRKRDGDDDDAANSAGTTDAEFTAEGAASLLGISLESDPQSASP